MPKITIVVAAAGLASLLTACAHPITPLATYADANGVIDVQALTCAQMNATDDQDANALATWYSGWYNGLAKKHSFNFPRTIEGRNRVIAYCRAHPELRVIQAIAMFLKDEKENGIGNVASR
jgi:HdeA/HdeB family